MRKNVLPILGGILVLLIAGFAFYVFTFRPFDNEENEEDKPIDEPIKEQSKYELVEDKYDEYKYITSYDEYLKFLEDYSDYEVSKELTEEDFNNKMYLFYNTVVDSCSEDVIDNYLSLKGDKYHIYFDVNYTCGVCAPNYVTYVYEVKEINLDIEKYVKVLSREECDPDIMYKPIIYIYPNEDMDLTIKLGNEDDLIYTYPKYKNEWHVKVSTDGNIYDYDTMRNYYGLYWEAYSDYKFNMNEGFVIKGEDTTKFLEEKLAYLGLNEYEINEFIIYWIDKLENNKYNFISFRSIDDINKDMPLEFSNNPDTLIRIMVDFKALEDYIEVKEQNLVKQERNGYTIVEWGGAFHK